MESKNLTVEDIVDCTNGDLIIGDKTVICKKFERDTRKIQKGDVFIAIKGQNFDGNKLWEEAFENGAKVIIVTEVFATKEELKKYTDKTIIKVKNQIEALRQIATKKRELYGENFPVIAVTGSVGKTSTKDIIANVLAQKYKVLKTQGNLNNEIGVPLTILSLQDEDIAVVEIGMNHFDEISRLSKIVKPTIGVITNIGTSHIGNLGSRENILKAKLEILDGMKKAFLIINNDNDLLHKWGEDNKDIVKTFGIENLSDANATNIQLQGKYSEFICSINEDRINIKNPIGGNHFILNSLCAALIGKNLNLTNEQIKKGIETFKLTQKRMEIIELKNGAKIINDSYNASYESMKAAIEYLSNFQKGRKIAVLGDMFELGEHTEELHKKVGKEIENNKINILVCAGNFSKDIAEEAIRSGMPKENVYYYEEIEEMEKFISNIIKKDDYILIKASNGMKFYEIAERLILKE